MAGYSGTPLVRKLGIKDEFRVLLRNAPDDFAQTLGPLPPGVRQLGRAGRFDLALLFSKSRRRLAAEFPMLAAHMETAGMLWVGWPKKAAKIETDLSFDAVQKIGLDAGLVDVKICAIDETWSGLKFVRRLRDR